MVTNVDVRANDTHESAGGRVAWRQLEGELRDFRQAELAHQTRPSTAKLVVDAVLRIALQLVGLAIFLWFRELAPLGYILFAIGTVSLLGSWFHDEVHMPSQKRTLLARIAGRFGSTPVGLSPLWWSYKHVKLHHKFVSDPRYDPDIQFKVLGRVSPDQAWRPLHRWQHIYMWFLLPFSTINMLKPAELVHIRSYSAKTGIAPGFSLARCWADKYLPFLLFWAFVGVVGGLSNLLVNFLAVQLITGLLVSLVTQVQHNTMLTVAAGRLVPQNQYLANQLFRSSDIGRTKNWWWWVTGGVTFHAAHHVIPTLGFLQTPATTGRLRSLIHRYGMVIPTHRNMGAAIVSHFHLVVALSHRDFETTDAMTRVFFESPTDAR